MKKLLVVATVAAAFTLSGLYAHAQGVVQFKNDATTAVTLGDSAAAALSLQPGANAPGGNLFRAALYYAPDSATAPERLDGTVMGATQGMLIPGQYNGGNRTTPSTTAPGAAAWFQVRVWEAAYGATYEAAFTAPVTGGRLAIVGSTPVFKVTTGAPPAPPTALAGNGLAPVSMQVVPEPSTIGLGLLGLAGLFLLRRRS